ncbi:probable GPI-anchored adhesin-like protein PGA18 [Pollicipes pollicipes]|uniref:probable GPI-anchored adhesin-like protein PGA18 n=1 Tax=Pollicipes pollicipes TaxID=41117 RepID=UPI0018850608|nr:probable GPI-anchored adhesin-like protein PGA18 [Pollicipes pollicipes]
MSAIQANLGSTGTTAATTAGTTAATSAGTTAATTAGTTPATSAGTTAATSTAGTTATSAPGAFTCPQPNGLFSDPLDCQSYYNCGWGVPHHTTCPSGTLFDPAMSNCNWANLVSCSTSPGGSTAASTSGTASTAASTTTSAPSGPFTCPSPTGHFADPADCHSYYNCWMGTAYHFTCAPGTSWSQAIVACDWSSVTGCY